MDRIEILVGAIVLACLFGMIALGLVANGSW